MTSTETKETRRGRMFTIVGVVWFLAGLFGDELVGLWLFGWETDASTLSLFQSWWWKCQFVLLLIFAPILLVIYFWPQSTQE